MNQLSIPQGLNTKQAALYRALMNDEAPNTERRWHYNKYQDLLGIKKTNDMNGDVKVSFKTVKRIEPLVVKEEDENVITKKMLLKSIHDFDLDIEVIERKKEAMQLLLHEFFEKK